MCDHCGCRAFPAIAALTTQHEQIQHTAGLLRHAIGRGDHQVAQRLLIDLADLLAPHVAAEERGLFAELRNDETVRLTIEQLCAEHTKLDAALRPPPTLEPPTLEPPTLEPPTLEPPTLEPPTRDQPDWAPVLAALDLLRDHIDKEEYGVFPAAVILLPTTAWDRITSPNLETPDRV